MVPRLKRSARLLALLALFASDTQAQNQLTSFTATALTGKTVTAQRLLGRPFILIITPSRAAAKETRQWAQALRQELHQPQVPIRDLLVIDLPFFMSERDALDRAREKIPERYHDQTYLLVESDLERNLGTPPSSEDAYVLVFNSDGRVMARVNGAPSTARMNVIQAEVKRLLP